MWGEEAGGNRLEGGSHRAAAEQVGDGGVSRETERKQRPARGRDEAEPGGSGPALGLEQMVLVAKD